VVTGALSLWVKRTDHEADHSPPSSAEVKNAWSYTSTSQYAFMSRCLAKSTEKTLPLRLPLIYGEVKFSPTSLLPVSQNSYSSKT